MLGLISGISITLRATEALLEPWLSLLIRLWLAQGFIIAGVHQMMDHAGEQAMIGWQPALLHEITSSDPGSPYRLSARFYWPSVCSLG